MEISEIFAMDDIRLQFISVKWHNQSQQDNSEDNVVMIIKAPGENSKKKPANYFQHKS